MHLLAEKIKLLRIDWNKRPLTEADFHRLCRRHKVAVQELPLKVSGFYYSMLGRHYIAVSSDLSPQRKLFVMFHEFAHFLFHVPDTGTTANFHGIGGKTRKETEADAFALCALMPLTWIEADRLAEFAEDAGCSLEMVQERIRIYDRFAL